MCLPNINVHLHFVLNIPSIVFTKLISVLFTTIIKWVPLQCHSTEDDPSELRIGRWEYVRK